MMRKRHIEFSIIVAERKVWLAVFYSVLDEAVDRFNFPEEHLMDFRKYLEQFSHWMVSA
jgi:hemoglobin